MPNSDKHSLGIKRLFSRSISKDLTICFVLIILISATLVILVNYYLAAIDAQKHLNQKADEYISYLAGSLELPLWDFDDGSVLKIGRSYSANELIAKLRITEFSGRVVYSITKEEKADLTMRKREIIHDGQIVGYIELGLTSRPYKESHLQLLWANIFTITVVVISLSIAAGFLFRTFLKKPLDNLIVGINQIAQGDYEHSFSKAKQIEIKAILSKFDYMAEQVKGREHTLSKVNRQLEEEIAERKRGEEEMRRLRNYLQNIVDSMPSVVVGINPDGKVTQWNREAEKITGVAAQEVRGCALADVFPQLAGEMEKVRQAIRERKPLKDAKVVTHVNDEKRFSDVTIYPLVTNEVEGAVIRVDDVTERVRMEEMMIQSEKMLSVGGLAAGMAHEINNPLAAIMQNAQVVLLRTSKYLPANKLAAEECGTSIEAINKYMEEREILKMLEAVRASGEQAAKIVENMLSFSRKSESVFLPHVLSDLLDNTAALASSDYDLKKKYDFRRIKILRDYDSDLPQVPCEASQIQQVILNLLKNAAEVMADQEEKTAPPNITLRTSKEGDMARIEVEDNGPGMEENVCKRVFEPFFTTKELGVGTGLGLSVSYFIITENHGGTMEVQSVPGQGSKFIICLPLRN